MGVSHSQTYEILIGSSKLNYESSLQIRCPFLGDIYKRTTVDIGVYKGSLFTENIIWVIVKMMVSFWISIIIRHLICRVPKKGPYF